jgi:hypothetical protein
MITAQEYTLIQFSDLLGLMPVGFVDKIYIERQRPVRVGVHEELFITERKMSTTYDTHPENRKVQALIYDKYRVQFLRKESYHVEALKFAEMVTVYSYGEKKTYTAKITDVQTDNIAGSSASKVTLEFYDVNSANYYQSNVVNFLRSDTITARVNASQLTKIQVVVTSLDNYVYYSPFNPEMKESDLEVNEGIDYEGERRTARTVTKSQQEIMFYLNQANVANFKKKIVLCSQYNMVRILTAAGTTYRNKDLCTYEVEEIGGAVDLYKVILRINTDINNSYHY